VNRVQPILLQETSAFGGQQSGVSQGYQDLPQQPTAQFSNNLPATPHHYGSSPSQMANPQTLPVNLNTINSYTSQGATNNPDYHANLQNYPQTSYTYTRPSNPYETSPYQTSYEPTTKLGSPTGLYDPSRPDGPDYNPHGSHIPSGPLTFGGKNDVSSPVWS
jgi:hypothetical protein